jgi:hypothetical protein
MGEGGFENRTFQASLSAMDGFDELLEAFLKANDGNDFKRLLAEDVDYSAAWAYVLALASGWAYAEGQVVADKLSPFLGALKVTELRVDNAALCVIATAYVIEVGDTILLAFRGTDPQVPINWLTNFETAVYEFGTKQNPLGSVHSGFFMNVEALWPYIHQAIGPLLRDESGKKRLFITGHSLGAAMAVIAGARIYKSPVDGYLPWQRALRGIYTFGQPYVGDDTFCDVFRQRFGSKLHRHVYRKDVVPCLPPRGVEVRFAQFGDRRSAEEISAVWEENEEDHQIGAAELLEVLPAALESRIAAWKAVAREFRLFAPPVRLFSIDDHSPRAYIEVSRHTLLGKGRGRAHSLGRHSNGGGPFSGLVQTIERASQTIYGRARS